MKIYIFVCNNDTMTDCLKLNIFGVADPYVSDIEIGDYCLLYNFDPSERKIYGLWKATSKCGTHKFNVWGGKYRYQVWVKQVSKTLISIPFDTLKNFFKVDGEITWKHFGNKAQVLLQCYASE